MLLTASGRPAAIQAKNCCVYHCAGSALPYGAMTARPRVIMHCDMDCFYAAVEAERFPHWRQDPIGVVQNGSLVVTTNYRARALGVPKTGAAAVAYQYAPHMRFAGSNMKRYRKASRAWLEVFRSFGCTVMKRSIDDSYSDLTELARERIRQGKVKVAIPHRHPERIAQEREERHRRAIQAMEEERAKRTEVWEDEEESSGSLRAAILSSRSTDPLTTQDDLKAGTGKAMARGPQQPPLPPLPRFTGPFPPSSASSSSAASSSSSSSASTPLSAAPSSSSSSVASSSPLRPASLPPVSVVSAPSSSPPVVIPGGPGNARLRRDLPELSEEHKRVRALSPHEFAAHCEAAFPIDHCRAAPGDEGPLELVGMEEWEEQRKGNAETAAGAEQGGQLWLGKVHLAEAVLPQTLEEFMRTEDPNNPSQDFLLAVGSQIAFEMRLAVYSRLGFTTSAGIGPNMMLARVASSLAKPNQQSIIRPCIALPLLAPLPLKQINGFGPKACERAAELGFRTIGQLQACGTAELLARAGDEFGGWLRAIAEGRDDTEVEASGPPKQLGVEKRQHARNEQEKELLLRWIAEQLYSRMVEDEESFSRQAPLGKLTDLADPVGALFMAGRALLRKHVPPEQPVRLLGLAAASFLPLEAAKPVSAYFKAPGAASAQPACTEVMDLTPASPTSSSSSAAPRSRAPPAAASALAARLPASSLSSSRSSSPPIPSAPSHPLIQTPAARPGRPLNSSTFSPLPAEPGAVTVTGKRKREETAHYRCDRCQQEIPETERVEHEDWHVAAALQKQLRAEDINKREEARVHHKTKKAKSEGRIVGWLKPSVPAASSTKQTSSVVGEGADDDDIVEIFGFG